MPIFEYRCKKCNEVFEILIRSNEKPVCPSCKSKRLEKLISSFNAASEKPYRKRKNACRGQSCDNRCCGGCCCGGCD
ncbi:MAG: zinc ribbon domain-containing protein [Opitutales bacterium]|nr:zinc ribbon domain-containing protein [Opitutales bacterium]